MHIVGQPFERINLDFLRYLARDRVRESVTHDYKRMVAAPADAPGQARFLEGASAFANTQGGIFVIGFDSESTKRRWRVTGVADADGDARTLLARLRSGIEPDLATPLIRKVPMGRGKDVLLVGIERSLGAPHAVRTAKRHWFLRRDDDGTHEMTVAQVRSAFSEARAWKQEAEAFREGVTRTTPAGGGSGAVLVVTLPLGRLGEVADVTRLAALWMEKLAPWLKTSPTSPISHFARPNFDGWMAGQSFKGKGRHYQLFRDGACRSSMTLEDFVRERLPGQRYIDGCSAERAASEFAATGIAIMSEAGISPPYYVGISFLGLTGVTIAFARNLHPPYGETTLNPDYLPLPAIIVGSRDAPLAELLRPAFDVLWQAGGWPESPCIVDGDS